MKKLFLSLFMLGTMLGATAQVKNVIDIDMWPDGLPNSNGIDKTQPYDAEKRNFKPSIRVYFPEDSVKKDVAVLVIPGGGYRVLSLGAEGYDWANEFAPQGITTIVLSYRMPMGHKEVPMSDATEAIRIIREKATEWGIDPQKVGVLGSSAGGHLASTIATHNPEETRPNFQILFYPVISMDKDYTHMDSHNCFVGEDATREMEDLYSNHLQVNAQTPPAILLLSDDDFLVPPRNSAEYYLALKKAGVRANMHVYPSGGHGWGCGKHFKYHTQMMQDLQIWLDALWQKPGAGGWPGGGQFPPRRRPQ
ncbi:MAG: alpha/beta hydrolase [Bacteroidaceae bacterium]|nr:alpha/beta hydrolase [Bacteroidaceae bacterium]